MTSHKPFSRLAYVYLYGVIAVGCVAIGHSIVQLAATPTSNQWLILAALTFLTGSFSIKIPSVPARLSVSEAFIFASVLLFGPAAATLTVALDSVVMTLSRKRLGEVRLRFLFNLSTVSFSVWVAAQVFFRLAHATPGRIEALLPLEQHFWPLVALATIYFLLNTWIVAIAVAFEKRVNVISLWSSHFLWFGLNYFAGVSLAALLVSYTRSVDFSAIAIILPLLALSYVGHRMSLGRIDDAKRHVDRVNELYMSTIETLAMAIDAKDQITHGHIRRVQLYAVELARRLGVSDEQQIRAIEAAALLHDMGKLAIPEHILNKPGKLTEAEFERMKRHADIGADLLSSIKFPYPVTPIVRHHHEQWDGKGYPAGISGSDIPLGARILAVVDCFDALTSDRPYRPRLMAQDAFSILRERRGTMYDPLVVDAFIQHYGEIAAVVEITATSDGAAFPLQKARDPQSPTHNQPLSQIRASAVESTVLAECARGIASSESAGVMLAHCARALRQLTPATVYALYAYDAPSDSLICQETFGDPHGLLRRFVVPLGQRVSGWSAANDRTSINSDARLELGPLADEFSPALRSSLATPIHYGGSLVGTICAFSSQTDAFREPHRYTFEQVAGEIAVQLAAVWRIEPHRTVVSFRARRD